MKKGSKDQSLTKKLEYIGLDLDHIPATLKLVEDLKFKPIAGFDEKKYRQYRYVSPKEIEILLSPTNRLEDIKEKYSQALPLIEYLKKGSEEEVERNLTFLRMLKEVEIEDIEEIEKNQQELNKKIPFKVRYTGNYLWQIYYSQASDKYFMIVPTEDKDYSAFFYVLKKQVEKKKAGKIFVPISNADYSKELLNKTEIQSLENYLWLITKDWPSIYEVYDKSDKVSLQIVGQTEVYGKIRSEYKVKLTNKIEATKFFKLAKALFILQSELPDYFTFETQIDKQGSLEFYYESELLEYDDLSEWVNIQYQKLLEKLKNSSKESAELQERLTKLKRQTEDLEVEYLSKEKQISTYLNCKKTFFGKVKYFFKYSGKKAKKKEEAQIQRNREPRERIVEDEEIEDEIIKRQYTLDELIQKGKKASEKETEVKNTKMDINALKLKNVNLVKKIENATAFIEEIDNHKRSIFEFWKYSNKDEMTTLPEGEQEEVNIVNKIEKTFDYEEDIEKFGKTMDKMQRKLLNKLETDSTYIMTTKVLELVNKIKINDYLPKDIETELKEIKKEATQEKALLENEEFDIFGGLSQDNTKISKIKNKKHRELPKDRFNILEIGKNTKQIGFKLTIENVISTVNKALVKVVIPENLPVYKAIIDDKLDDRMFNIFNINPENEIAEAIRKEGNKINFYKLNLKEGSNAISFTNCIFYDNQNKTLPIGQDLSTKMLVDVSNLVLKLKSKNTFKIAELEDEKDDFSKINVKTVTVFEFAVDIKKQD